MQIRTEIENLSKADVYSLILFALYEGQKLPEYSTLSQMAYILDKDNLLKLFQFFGGLTIKIPTIEEFETLVYALLMFERVDIEHEEYDTVYFELKDKVIEKEKLKDSYKTFKSLLSKYDFNSGRVTDKQ